jgi:butyrate kinase
MALKIFAINPGSTSTKIAVFDGSKSEFVKTIYHDPMELKAYPTAASQYEYRYELIMKIVQQENINLNEIDSFVGRGGLLKPLKGGTYIIGKEMLEDLRASKYGNHASNLGAMIADKLAGQFGKSAYVVDPPVVDELMDEARLSGLPEICRKSVFHALNQKASAIYAANKAGIEYNKGRFIVAHLGGGISVGAHEFGRVVDVNNGLDEGPFSPERAGSLPTDQLVDLCFSGKYTKSEIKKLLVGNGGVMAYTGTTDFIKLEILAETDIEIKKVLNAMVYQISREICASAAALNGKVDMIIITGGLAKCSLIVEGIKKRVSFLGTISVVPGEREMEALVEGAIRVMKGKEEPNQY